MNFVYGKFGKSVLFDEKKWTGTGGGNEAPQLLYKLAFLNPNDTFYVIGKNDLKNFSAEEKLRMFPHNNVIDSWEGFSYKIHDNTTWLLDKLKDIKFDGGIFYSGPISNNANIPDMIYTQKEPYRIAKVLECFKNYGAPIIHFLNITNIPYIVLSPDIRYIPLQAKDLFNREKRTLSQVDAKWSHKHIRSYEYEDQINKTIVELETKCDGIEIVWFLDKQPQDASNFEKTEKFVVVLNEVLNGGQKKANEIQKYVLDHFKDVEIIGKWSDSWYEDTRFTGPLKFVNLLKRLVSIKYTFLIPPGWGWVTPKFWEMNYFGIIPFLHPGYDIKNTLNVPDFIRIKDGNDLKEKIEFLENNEEYYWQLRKELSDLIKPEHFTGEILVTNVMRNLYEVLGIKKEYKTQNCEVKKVVTTFF